jgi:PAS domain S-box-containing protein
MDIEFYKSILESSYAGIVTCDIEGNLNYANKRSTELRGVFFPDGTTLETWSEKGYVYHVEEDTRLIGEELPLLKALRKEVTIRDQEARMKRADGSWMYISISANPLYQEGKLMGAMASYVDISASRQKARELSAINQKLQESINERTHILQDLNLALGRSQTRFRTIVEQSPFGIQIFSSTGKTILINPAWNKIFHLPDEMIQNFILKEYNVLTDPILEKGGQAVYVRRAFAGETVTLPDLFYNPRDNGFDFDGKWLESIMYPLKQPDGSVREVVLIHNDVTEKYAARELKNRFKLTQDFLARVTDLLLSTLDHEEIITQIANFSVPFFADGALVDLIEDGKIKRIVTHHCVPEAELLMKEVQDLYSPTMDSPQPSARVIREGLPELLESVYTEQIAQRTRDPHHADLIRRIGICSHIAVPLIFQGKVIGALNFLITTDRRHFDEQDLAISIELARRSAIAINNARLYRDAQQAIQQRDDFISIASHELKTPITSLKLQQEVIIHALSEIANHPDAEFIQRSAGSYNKQLDRLTRLVEDMLDISRISTGKLAMDFKKVDFAVTVLEVIDRFRSQLKSLNISLVIEPLKPLFISCDPYRMEQVITNLMTNAIRYGGKKPIHLSMVSDADHLYLKVKDHGIGIATIDQERIFNRFERAISFDHISGLGLGLYISRQIVQDHGGELSVESSPKTGSTFIIKLKLV